MDYTFNDLMKEMDNGIVSEMIYRNEFKIFRELPNIPKDYFLPIAGIDLITDDDCKLVIKYLRKRNNEIDEKHPQGDGNIISFTLTPYETDCFFLQLHLGQLFDFWHNKLTYIKNDKLEFEYELLVDMFWDCVKNKCTYEELKEYSNRFYKCYLEVSDKECESL